MRKYVLIYCILFSSLTSCFYDPPAAGDTKFRVKNESGEEVYCYPSLDDSIEDIPSVLENKESKSDEFLFSVIEIPKNRSISIGGVSVWDDFINLNSRDSTIRLFIFSKAIVKKEGWNNIIKNKKYLKKYELKESDLNLINWIVTYP